MKVSNMISSYKITTGFLAVTVLSCMYFSYKLYDEKNNAAKSIISQNSSLKTALNIEKQKVTYLLEEINNSKIEVESSSKEVNRLKNAVTSLSKEKVKLGNNSNFLKTQKDSAELALSETKKYNDDLMSLNDNLSWTVKIASKISIINLKATANKLLKTGDLKETYKANKADVLQISFDIIGNKIQKSYEKDYYVQIIDSKNNIVGGKLFKRFGPMILDYSYATSVKFTAETFEVVTNLEIKNLEKGNYYVNVFDKGELVSKDTFALR